MARLLNNSSNRYHDFDISALQFPEAADHNIEHLEFTEHDIRKPFMAKYHGQFDLVNVRLVGQALQASDVKRVVSNLAELLCIFSS